MSKKWTRFAFLSRSQTSFLNAYLSKCQNKTLKNKYSSSKDPWNMPCLQTYHKVIFLIGLAGWITSKWHLFTNRTRVLIYLSSMTFHKITVATLFYSLNLKTHPDRLWILCPQEPQLEVLKRIGHSTFLNLLLMLFNR